MNYDYLTILVVITAVATFALWRNSNRPKFKQLNKKFRKALWESNPIEPKHNKPKFEPFNRAIAEWDAKFFYEFDDFADVMNWYLADDNEPTSWRLQELPYTDVGRADDGPSSEHTAATNAINSAMQRALWDSYRISQFDFSGDTDWGELEVRMHGTPTFYFDRRDCQAFAELKCARKVAA